MEIIEQAPKRAIVVTPHPDDCEGGCGGTMAKWIDASYTDIVVILCTKGDKGTGDRSLTPEKLTAIREIEQQNASDSLGISRVVFLRHPDGGLEDDEEFRRELVYEIRKHKPEVLFCIDPVRSTTHTHRDHRKSGQCAIDAAFSFAPNPNVFPDQISDDVQAHQMDYALLWSTEDPDAFINTKGYVDMKADSLLCHVSQIPNPEGTRKRLHDRAEEAGEKCGLEHAEGFRKLDFRVDPLERGF